VVIRIVVQRKDHFDFRSPARLRFNAALSVKRVETLLKIGQAVTTFHSRSVKAAAVVRDGDFEIMITLHKLQLDFGRSGMTNDIVQAFLDCEKEIVPRRSVHSDSLALNGDFEPTNNA
jgi:hypothetical protein